MDRRVLLKKLGHRVRTIRLSNSQTQAELAYRAGLDPNYIGLIERGQRNPTYLSLIAVSKGLGVNLSDLLDYETTSEPTIVAEP